MKTITTLFAAAFVLCAVAGCNSNDTPIEQPVEQSKALLLTNGQFYTVNPNQPWVEAMVIEEGKITYLGGISGAEIYLAQQQVSQVDTTDLGGKMIIPGLHDVHSHPLEAGSDLITCLLDQQSSIQGYINEIDRCAKSNGANDWFLGWGHDLETLLDASENPVDILSELVPNMPAAIMEQTSHSVWVNHKALELLNINAQTPHPTGGAILKNQQGNPSGILLDAAGELVFDFAMKDSEALKERNYQGLLYSLEQLAKNGITSVVDARVYWKRGYLEAWQRAATEKKLTARTNLSLWAYPNENDEQQISLLKSLYSNEQNSLLKVNQIKFYSDGILHNTTAALNEPYSDYFAEVGPVGLNYFSETRLSNYITELERVGFDMHIHAIGDRGVHESLNAIESALKANTNINDRRHRLTHIELVAESDKPRFHQLDVIADFQLAGDFAKPENAHWNEDLIGNRAYETLPVRDIFDTGATLTLSSDWDVSSLSPFVGMQNALTRGDQSLPDLESVIESYTINAAYLMRQDELVGSFEVGKDADLIVLNQNLFDVSINQIAQTQVEKTMLQGHWIYQQETNKSGKK